MPELSEPEGQARGVGGEGDLALGTMRRSFVTQDPAPLSTLLPDLLKLDQMLELWGNQIYTALPGLLHFCLKSCFQMEES